MDIFKVEIDKDNSGQPITLDTVFDWLVSDSFFGDDMLEDSQKFEQYKKSVAEKLTAAMKG